MLGTLTGYVASDDAQRGSWAWSLGIAGSLLRIVEGGVMSERVDWVEGHAFCLIALGSS